MPRIKVVVIGQTTVGKSCISIRAAGGGFDETASPTIGAASLNFNLKNSLGTNIETCVWDTAGQEKYRSLTPMYFTGASVAIFVYDITNNSSFSALSEWDTLLVQKSPASVLKVVAGNKIDLEEQREVDRNSVEEFAKQIGAVKTYEVSAKTGEGITEMFQQLVDLPNIHYEDTEEEQLLALQGGPIETKKKCC